MKSLTHYINEALMKPVVTRANESLKVRSTSKVNVSSIEGKEYILSTDGWIRSRVAIIMDIISNYKIANKKSLTNKQVRLINNLWLLLKYYYDTGMNPKDDSRHELRYLLNGTPPKFEHLKLIYDAIVWTLNEDSSCTIPRRRKLENIMKQLKPYEDDIKKLEY